MFGEARLDGQFCVLFTDEKGKWGRGDEAVIVRSCLCSRIGHYSPRKIRDSIHCRRKNHYSVIKSAPRKEKEINK